MCRSECADPEVRLRVPPNDRLQLAGAMFSEERRIRNHRADRPQLQRGSLGGNTEEAHCPTRDASASGS